MAALNSSHPSPLPPHNIISPATSSSSLQFYLPPPPPKLFFSPKTTQFQSLNHPNLYYRITTTTRSSPAVPVVLMSASAMPTPTGIVQENLPPALDSTSDPPPIFDGTTRLYISYTCPYAQRVWITRNCKGLHDTIKLVPIDLPNRPDWYKEKVYPPNKVPALEHNNEVKGESLDLIKYIDSNFEGPSLFPDDPAKKEFAEELFSYTDSFNRSVITFFKTDEIDAAATAFDHIETALSKFDDGPFFLGQFSLVDIAYAPFIERFQAFSFEVKNYDITEGRPKLSAWIQEMDKNEGFGQTRRDPKELVETYKRRFSSQA